jgi:hypothetical protein
MPLANSETGHAADAPRHDASAREKQLIASKERKSLCPDTLSPFPYKVRGQMLELWMEPS